MNEHKSPKWGRTSFHCPHCGDIATQDWWSICGAYQFHDPAGKHVVCHKILDDEGILSLLDYRHQHNNHNNESRRFLTCYQIAFKGEKTFAIHPITKIAMLGLPAKKAGTAFSICSGCGRHSIWLNEVLLYPETISVENPNEDLSNAIKKDYREAANILGKSPKAAAALLRSATEKLCLQIGGSEKKSLADNIKSLIEEGKIPKKLKPALETLRIVGNHATHPGFMDDQDNAAIAIELFEVVNQIADIAISKPNRIDKLCKKVSQLDKLERRRGG